jgi:hypothetical protein
MLCTCVAQWLKLFKVIYGFVSFEVVGSILTSGILYFDLRALWAHCINKKTQLLLQYLVSNMSYISVMMVLKF